MNGPPGSTIAQCPQDRRSTRRRLSRYSPRGQCSGDLESSSPSTKPGQLHNLKTCADCGCCLKVCDAGAVQNEFVGIGKLLRGLVGLRDGATGEEVHAVASTQ